MAAEQTNPGEKHQKAPEPAGSRSLAAVSREANSQEAWTSYKDTQLTRTEPALPGLQLVDEIKRNRLAEPGGAESPAVRAKAVTSADAIQHALHGGLTRFTGIGGDGNAVLEILRNSTEREKELIDQTYRTKFGTTLDKELRGQFSGAELDRAINILNRKDNNRADDAGNIHASLIERGQWVSGRSDGNIEKDLRDTVSTMNSTQIAEVNRDYQNRYGISLETALLQDPNLSKDTKESLSIYLKGTDKRSAQDTIKLADIALGAEDLTMLSEAFRGTSADVRRQFAQQGGEGKLREAFGGGDDFRRSQQFTSEGKLSAAQLVRDNNGTFNDNEKGIEMTVKAMTPDERRAYNEGKSLSAQSRNGLNAEQLKSLTYFTDLNNALKGAGNSTEVAAWESLIASPSGSLVNDLAKHKGVFNDSSAAEVVSTVENMSKEDWQRLKTEPAYRREVQGVLSFLSSGELARVNGVLEAKLSAPTFEDAQRQGRRPILDAVNDNEHLFGNDRTQIVESVRNMTPDEQRRYRDDAAFRRDLDSALTSSLGRSSSELQITKGLLDKVARGEKPEQGLAEALYSRSAGDRDGAQALRDLESALTQDPGLRQRLLHPKTAEDNRIIDALNKALPTRVGGRGSSFERGFDRYAKPLLEAGSLPMEKRFELNRDLHSVLTDITKITPDDKTRLLMSEQNQRRLLGRFDSQERELVLNVLRQGTMDNADKVREFSLAENVDGLKSTLSGLEPSELQQMRQDFAGKYGDVTAQVLDRLSGDDKTAVALLLRDRPSTDREAFNDNRAPVYMSQDGLGRWFVNNLDGTSYQLDTALSDYSARMSDASKTFSQLPADEQARLQAQVNETLREYKSSEATAASVATDVVIVAGTVATTVATGGVSLVVLGAAAAGGAVAKVGINAAVRGADYDTGTATLPETL
ncbi:MAG: hypothetical protein SGJ27_09315 [Candidatus Melainabacteria bacterium]|nr:hypothetical protein [Candidatus Melainabacteria bacterium]